MSFTKMNVRKTHTKAQADQFAADYGFTKFETLTTVDGEIHVLLAQDITGEQAARYFRDHKYVTKIEAATGYFLRP